MIITSYPTRIHSAYNPIIVKGTPEADETTATLKVAFGHHYQMPDNYVTLEREFFNGIATFNLSSLITSWFNKFRDERFGMVVNNNLRVLYTVFNGDAILYHGTALNAVSQVGEPSDMVSYLGCFLTGFDKIKTYENYQREVYVVAFENAETCVFADDNIIARTSVQKHFGVNIWSYNASTLSVANSDVDIFLRNNQGEIVTDNYGNPIEILAVENGIYRHLEIESCCTPRNPFYIRWINHLGGLDYWLFGVQQRFDRKLSSLDTFEPYIEDVESATEKEVPISVEAEESVLVGAENLSENEFEQLSKIIYSPLVEWYDEKRAKWLRIIPDKGNVENNTRYSSKEIELKFILPKPILQF